MGKPVIGISLSGAADNIPFHTGALEVMGDVFRDEGLVPSIITGTSSGAIVAAYVAQSHPMQLHEASRRCTNLVMAQIDGIDKVSSWFYPPYLGGLYHTGLRSTKRMHKLLTRNIDPERVARSLWKCRVVTTNLRRGVSRSFGPRDAPDFIQAVRMSAAYPVLFEALRFRRDGALFTDGILDMNPLRHCIELGADLCIAVSASDPDTDEGWDDTNVNAIAIAKRVIDLMARDIWRRDLEAVERNNALACGGDSDKRVVDLVDIRPSEGLGKSTNFSRREALRALERGRADTLHKLRQAGITGKVEHV